MTEVELEKIREKYRINNPWAFFQDILYLVSQGIDFGMIDVHLDGGRKFGKTYCSCDSVAKLVLICPHNLDVYLFRWLKGDSNELANELIEAVERNLGEELTKKELNKSSKTFTINGNKLRVMGIHTPSSRKAVNLTGIKRAVGKKYAVVVMEEAYEFTEKEILDIKHALGGYKNYIFIYITNPNSLAIPFIAEREKQFQHNETELRDKGYQFQIRYEPNKTTIWFYGNWRINPYLELADVNLILETWKIDPARARVVDYGMPGVEENGIYVSEFPKVRRIPLKDLETLSFSKISGGIDWGDGNGVSASATTFVVVFQDYNNATYTLPLYYHNNKDGYKSPQQRCQEITEKLLWLSKWRPQLTWGPFEIYLDTGLYAEKEFLEIEKAKQGLSWISYNFARKFQERTRINLRKYRMNTGRYYVVLENEDYFNKLLNELQLQTWDPNKRDKQNLPKQLDAFNHITDGEDYAICQETYKIAEEEQYKLLNKW